MTMDLQDKTYPAKSAQQMMDLTIEWANKAGFYGSTTPEIQLEKFLEEHNEVLYAVKGYYGQLTIGETEWDDLTFMGSGMSTEDVKAHWLEKIKDGVGDSMVTYFIQCGLRGHAPSTIKDPSVLGCFATHYGSTAEVLTGDLGVFLEALRDVNDSDTPVSSTVVRIHQCTGIATWIGHLFGFTPEECFDHAYTIISKRVGKGKVVNGVFVKEEDLTD